MTPAELETILRRLDMTQVQFAQLIGYKQRAIRYWVAGGHPIPPPAAILARLLLRCRITPQEIESARKKA